MKKPTSLLLALVMLLSLAACGKTAEIKNELDPENPLPADPGVKVTEETFDEACLILGLPSGVTAEVVASDVPGSSANDICVTKDGSNWKIVFHPVADSTGNIKNNLAGADPVFEDQDSCTGQIQGMDATFYARNIQDGHLDTNTAYRLPAYDIVVDYGETAIGAWAGMWVEVTITDTTQTNIYELIHEKEIASVLNHITFVEGDPGQVLSSGGITITVPAAWAGSQDDPAGPTGHFPPKFPTPGSVSVKSVFGGDPAAQAARKGDVFPMSVGGRDFQAVKVVGDQYSYLYLFDTFNDERSLCVTLQMVTADESVLDEFAAGDIFENVVASIEVDPDGYIDTTTVDKEGDWTIGKAGELVGYDGTSAADVEIPETISGRSVTAIYAEVFKGHSEIVTITIPEGVELIAANAFEGCENLTTVSFPSTLVEIQQNAFRDCPNLTDVTLPKSVRSIGNSAFVGSGAGFFKAEGGAVYDSKALSESTFDSITVGEGSDLSADKIFYMAQMTELVLPDQMDTPLGESLASGCTNLTKANLPDGIQEIPNSCFSDAPIKWLDVPASVTKIGDYAIGGDTVFLRNPAVEIGTEGIWVSILYLYDVYSADQLDPSFADNVIVSYRFYLPMDATMAEEAAFNEYLFSIGYQEPRGWIGAPLEFFDTDYNNYVQDGNYLTSYVGDKEEVYVPYYGNTWDTWDVWNIKAIGEGAFAGNTKIKTISLGATFFIGSKAFDGCTSLTDIWMDSEWIDNLGGIASDAFVGAPDNLTIHLPECFTASERDAVISALHAAGLSDSAAFEYYSFR